jgi:hypothetical protein
MKKQSSLSTAKPYHTHRSDSSAIDKHVQSMKRIIAAQPSALQAIYLEALLNPDQWQANHHLRTSPLDLLTVKERQRLRSILARSN